MFYPDSKNMLVDVCVAFLDFKLFHTCLHNLGRI